MCAFYIFLLALVPILSVIIAPFVVWYNSTITKQINLKIKEYEEKKFNNEKEAEAEKKKVKKELIELKHKIACDKAEVRKVGDIIDNF